MTRNRLFLKEATKLSQVRHNATRNPFIINHFYDILGKVLVDLGISDRPDLIWNADESGLPYEPKKCRVISGKGQKTLQIKTSSDRENVTVMATCSAVGVALPPLIIHQGQHVQSTWRPIKPAGTKYYPWQYANTSGWMTSEIFFKWFKKFEEETRIYDAAGETLEPRVLIYDGHLLHVWYGTLEHARETSVSIIKLPPRTTELLQPLDVGVFKSLKDTWGAELFKRLRLDEAEFTGLLSKEEVWGVACSIENIQNGFKRCGIYPINREQYPQHRFSDASLKKYNEWVAGGKKEITHSEVLEAVIEENKPAKADSTSNECSQSLASISDDVGNGDGEKVEYKVCVGRVISYFVPDDKPEDIMSMDSSNSSSSTPLCSTPTASTSQKSFQELCLEKLDRKPEKIAAATGTRKKVNPYSEIVTSDEQFERIIKEAERKDEEKANKARKKEEKAKKMKAIATTADDASYDDTEDEEEEYDDSDASYEDEVIKYGYMFHPASERQAYLYLRSVWESVNPPVTEVVCWSL